ncbi:MAG: hypothetical protein KDD61_13750 [Bdellovibrionales bacterium]|nr:hypothetical protein [Bdellovibrionales bacterium]
MLKQSSLGGAAINVRTEAAELRVKPSIGPAGCSQRWHLLLSDQKMTLF